MACEMKTCPNCGGEIGVIDTRALEKEIVRTRCCLAFGRRFETVETVTQVVHERSPASPRLVTKSHVARV